MKKSWIILIALLLVLAGASYGTARLVSRPPAAPAQSEPLMAMLHSYLRLTPDQQREIAQIDARYSAERAELRQKMWEERDRFAAVMRDPNSTKEQALAAMRRFASARTAMGASTLSYVFEIRQLLTPEQRARLTGAVDRGICALAGGPGVGGCGRGMGAPGAGMCPSGPGPRGPRWAR